MSDQMKILKAISYAANDDILDAEQALGLADAKVVSTVRHKKTVRTMLVAAAVACLMTVTALAVVHFNMNYRFTEEGEQQQYTNVTYTITGTDVYESSMVMKFDATPENYVYAFRAGWLPSEPTAVSSLYDKVRWRMDDARTDEEIFAEMGVTAEEAKTWYTRYDADVQIRRDEDGMIQYDFDNGGDIPYQVELYSDLYQHDFLVGYDGSEVEIIKEETSGDWQILWLHMDQNGAPELRNCNIVFRFNQAEGYLIKVVGTLDCETLGKIAENVEVLRTDMIAESAGERHGIVALGHG